MGERVSLTRRTAFLFEAVVSATLRGRWCVLRVGDIPHGLTSPIALKLEAPADGMLPAVHYATPMPAGAFRASRVAIIYVPVQAHDLQLYVHGIGLIGKEPALHARPLPRWLAGLAIVALAPLRAASAVLRALPGAPHKALSRMRKTLATLAIEPPPQQPYEVWVDMFDTWTEADRAALLASPRREIWPVITVALYNCDSPRAAVDETAAALAAQWQPAMRVADLARPQALREAMDEPVAVGGMHYVAVVQAGEILPPQALAVLADQAALFEYPDALFADEDQVNANFLRSDPHFKPELGSVLLASGTLTRGVWLFRAAAWPDLAELLLGQRLGDAARLAAALGLAAKLPGFHSRRVPFILTHCRPDTARTAPAALARLAQDYFTRRNNPVAIAAGDFPLKIHPRVDDAAAQPMPKISIIIPTAARSQHVAKCLADVIGKTRYPDFELVLVVSQPEAPDEAQRKVLAPLLATGRVKVHWLQTNRFNYSRANNYGASLCEGALLCLLNDDVAPMDPLWLAMMTAYLRDEAIGAVGAKLVYPNDTVQHGGVIIGLAGLCDHVNRHLPMRHPGYAHRAVLDQDLSCVTGACLLTRRDVFQAVGGLDEELEIAFNDVDFCLKIRRAGWRIIYCAHAVLRHHESLSLGHHFAGDRAALEPAEVGLMRARWQGVCAADPFHNPNLSLQWGHEWQLAYPPRVTKPFAEIVRKAPEAGITEAETSSRELTHDAALCHPLSKPNL